VEIEQEEGGMSCVAGRGTVGCCAGGGGEAAAAAIACLLAAFFANLEATATAASC
jgi:hypothetical protein